MATFVAVNTRHAGLSSVPLTGLRAGALILLILCMYLAPVPYAVVLNRSDPNAGLRDAEIAAEALDQAAMDAAAAIDQEMTPSAAARRRYVAGRRGPASARFGSDSTAPTGPALSERACFCSKPERSLSPRVENGNGPNRHPSPRAGA